MRERTALPGSGCQIGVVQVFQDHFVSEDRRKKVSMGAEEAVYLTEEGVVDLREELENLVSVKRVELAARLHYAIQQGDLSENADYQAAKEEQGFLEGRIQKIEAMLRRAVVIGKNVATDRVAIGSRVHVVEEGTEIAEEYHIVGFAEADPGNGKVSDSSPLGQALLGHSTGDKVQVKAPVGEILFRIVKIS